MSATLTGIEIKDTDHHFVIDALTREISSKSPQKDILIKDDHNSERFTFDIPRFIEGKDVAKCNLVQVCYLNGRSSGVYTVDDMAIDPSTTDIFTCSWLISRNATKHVGKLTFMLRFVQMDDAGVISYAWSTKTYEKVRVLENIDAVDSFEDEYVDVIEQWKNDLEAEMRVWVDHTVRTQIDVAQISLNKENISTNAENISKLQDDTALHTDQIETNTENISANTQNISKVSKDLDVQKARMDAFTALGEGSTTGDAELADIRIDVEGETHKNAGAAVRAQINKRLSYKLNGMVYPPQGASIGFDGDDVGNLIVTVHTNRLTYLLPGSSEYGGTGISTEEVLEQLSSRAVLNDDGYLEITIPEYNALCFNTTSLQLVIKSNRTVTADDLVLAQNSWANLCGGSFLNFNHRYEYQKIRDEIRLKSSFIYVGSDGRVKITRNTNTGDVLISLDRSLNIAFSDGDTSKTSVNIPVADILDQLGSIAVASNDGVIITLNSYRVLCYNLTTKKLLTRNNRNVTFDDIVLLNNAWSTVQGPLLMKANEHDIRDIQKQLNAVNTTVGFNSGDIFNTIDVKDKCREFASLFNGSSAIESFIFFADPHLLEHGENYESYLNTYITTIEKCYKSSPTSFVMCGGDWLGNSDTQEEARYKLGYIDGFMHGMFDKYYSVLGNHDTNYQGYDADGNAKSGHIGNETITNLWYREYGANYYTFDGNNTHFYVLDSGTDWENTMNDYRLDQLEWFANKLKSEDKPHSAVAIHIYFINTAGEKGILASEMDNILLAYHNRTSIEINGTIYDFSTCTGRVEFVITGHTHLDMTTTIGDTPVICTLNTRNGDVPSFDMVYVDYDNRKINLVRVGTGDNRSFDMSK